MAVRISPNRTGSARTWRVIDMSVFIVLASTRSTPNTQRLRRYALPPEHSNYRIEDCTADPIRKGAAAPCREQLANLYRLQSRRHSRLLWGRHLSPPTYSCIAALSGVRLDLGPGATVVLDVLLDHVGQTEAPGHGCRRRHVSCRGHVAVGVPRETKLSVR